MSKFEQDYTKLVSKVLATGELRASRAGPTVSLFGTTLTIDCLEKGRFPILTQRKIFLGGILGELAAFLRGATDLKAFKDFNCNYWDANAAVWAPNKGVPIEKQYVGRVYGAQWRTWTGDCGILDQLAMLVDGLKNNPTSRRHLLTTYNPAELDEMCLPPCHLLAQFNVRNNKHLDCIVTMRSVDLCLGLPSDIILYATLMLILCSETGHAPGKLTFMLGDTHVYQNHIDTFEQHSARLMHKLPTYTLRACSVDDFVPSDLQLNNYQHFGVLNYAFNN